MLRAAIAGVAAITVAAPGRARGEAPDPAAQLAALVPATTAPGSADDARRAIAIGRRGEVYEPDGKGGWVHRLPCSIAAPVTAAGRSGGEVLALGDGVIYRLAANCWSAIRLVQHGKALLGSGARALAAVGSQLFALDGLGAPPPPRLAQAPAGIVAIGAGPGATVIATEAGAFRLAGARLVPIKAVPPGARLAGDRWAIVDRGAIDLGSGKLTAWPAGLAIDVAAAGPGGALIAVGRGPTGLELVTLGAGRLARQALGVTGTPVGVVLDRAGRAVVALADGRLVVRERAGWSVVPVGEAPAPDRPGPPPARSELTETSAAGPR